LLDDSCNFFAWLLWFQALLDLFFFLKAYSNIEIFLVATYIFFFLGQTQTLDKVSTQACYLVHPRPDDNLG
jgi:hypothetical protein